MTMDLGVETLLSPSAALANQLVERAVSYGCSLGIYVAASVCDTTGRAIATLMHPNAASQCAAIAQDKASISAGFRLNSDELYQSIKGTEALKLGLTTRRGFALFGGGMPVIVNGQAVGGIGVSGGSEAQDVDCVRHALAGC
ncbi:heme-binding protein [Sphingobium phenoxybenzoativorans]|uniref:heme-binding protein n=1 Tax=Sphingobium phenoxybenzoativorans TaxID=1592790 RepID=UPI0009F6AC39|nr:heme-binding protein [Sphingobium phenoxybenzoativorans]